MSNFRDWWTNLTKRWTPGCYCRSADEIFLHGLIQLSSFSLCLLVTVRSLFASWRFTHRKLSHASGKMMIFFLSVFRVLSFNSVHTHHQEQSCGRMLKLLHKQRNLAPTLLLYPRKGTGVMDLVMLIEIVGVRVDFVFGAVVLRKLGNGMHLSSHSKTMVMEFSLQVFSQLRGS